MSQPSIGVWTPNSRILCRKCANLPPLEALPKAVGNLWHCASCDYCDDTVLVSQELACLQIFTDLYNGPGEADMYQSGGRCVNAIVDLGRGASILLGFVDGRYNASWQLESADGIDSEEYHFDEDWDNVGDALSTIHRAIQELPLCQ